MGTPNCCAKPEAAVLEFVQMTVAGAFGFRKNDQAHAAVDGFLGQPPQPLQILRAAYIWNRHVAEALHQPAINRNFEMRFQLPAAHQLRYRAVENERIEQVDVVHHENASSLLVESGRPLRHHLCTRKEGNSPAQAALQPIMFARIQNDREPDQDRHDRSGNAANWRSRERGCEPRPTGASYVNVHGARQDFKRLAMHGDDFPVHHDVHGRVERELHALDRAARGQRMFDVRSVIQVAATCGSVLTCRWVPSARIRSGRRTDPRLGAINMVPPVYLLLLKVRNRQRRSSHS